MKKGIIVIIGVCITVILLSHYYRSYSTLENCLKKNFPQSKVRIHYRDNEKKVILISEGTGTNPQYAIFKFDKKFGPFYSLKDRSNSGGVTIHAPFMITVSKRTGVGNIIWGVINNNEHITKAEIRFFNDRGISFSIKPNIIENVFVDYPSELYKTVNFFEEHWYYDIKAFNNLGEEIIDEKKLNIPGVF